MYVTQPEEKYILVSIAEYFAAHMLVDANTRFLLFVFFEGILCFQMIYIALQWFFVNSRKEYPYYLAYIFCMALYTTIVQEQELGFNLFHRIDPSAIQHFDRAIPLFAYFLYYRFARNFADIEALIPRLNRIIIRMEWLVLGYVCFELCWAFAGGNRQISEHVFWFISAVLFLSAVLFGGWIYSKRNTIVNILIFGAVVVNVGSLATVLMMYTTQSGLYYWPEPLLPLYLGIVVELLAFTTGLAYKSKRIEQEKEIYQKQLLSETEKNLVLSHKISAMRHDIAQEFHNDLSASISGVAIYISMLKKALINEPDRAQPLLEKANETLFRISANVADIIWSLNPGTQSIGHVIERCKKMHTEELEPIGVQLIIEANGAIQGEKLSIAGVRNMYLLLRYFMADVAKMGSAKKINVLLCHKEQSVNIEALAQLGDTPESTPPLINENKINTCIGAMGGTLVLSAERGRVGIAASIPLTNIRDFE